MTANTASPSSSVAYSRELASGTEAPRITTPCNPATAPMRRKLNLKLMLLAALGLPSLVGSNPLLYPRPHHSYSVRSRTRECFFRRSR